MGFLYFLLGIIFTLFCLVFCGLIFLNDIADFLKKQFPLVFPSIPDNPPKAYNSYDIHDLPTTTAVAVIDPFNFSLPLRREVFSGVLEADREYDIAITGVVQDCFAADRYSTKNVSTDAFYYQDNDGNFTMPHSVLRIGSKEVRHAELISVDRELHSYTYHFAGKGVKLAFCFNPRRDTGAQPRGSLHVSIQETAASIEARTKAIVQACANAIIPLVERQNHIQQLIALQEYESFRADPAWLEKHAVENQDKLLKNRDKIREENHYFRTHILPVLKEQEREDLIPFGEWERKALAIAERLAVEPPPQKSRPNFLEVRQRMTGFMQMKNEDMIALMQVKAKAIAAASTALDEYDLDPEVRQQMVQELVDSIVNEEGVNGNSNKKVI